MVNSKESGCCSTLPLRQTAPDRAWPNDPGAATSSAAVTESKRMRHISTLALSAGCRDPLNDLKSQEFYDHPLPFRPIVAGAVAPNIEQVGNSLRRHDAGEALIFG